MTSKAIAAGLIASVMVLAGCSTTSSPIQYKSSTKNVVMIEDHLGDSGAKVKTVDFTSAPGIDESPLCRAMGSISFGSGKTAAQFIHDALQEELFLAKAYSTNAKTVISGRIEKLDFSSVSPANWEISVQLSSSNGNSYLVENKYKFDTSWDAISACRNVADAFAPAVQSTIHKAVSDARFKSLMVSP